LRVAKVKYNKKETFLENPETLVRLERRRKLRAEGD